MNSIDILRIIVGNSQFYNLEEENYEFAIKTITKHKIRLNFEPKIGELAYTFRRYKKMTRYSITIMKFYYRNELVTWFYFI
jgi:hypothetical protein